MPGFSKTFSESWYRVAGQRITLRPQVAVHRQFFRGELWYVVTNPLTNEFFRIQPSAYEFVVRLRPDCTVEDVWKACLERDPEFAPGQEEVMQLLAQLYQANLLQYDMPADSSSLFNRYTKRRQKEIKSKILGIMFARFPLLDPDAFLGRTLPYIRPLLGWVGFAAWVAVVLGAVKVAIDHFPELVDQSQGILAPDNLVLLYASMVLIKTLHEFGHAYLCRHFGGEVHVMGVLLLVFTPIPYVDATSSWAFRNRRHRVMVGAGGMIVEILVAAIATYVWARTGPGLLHGLAYNMMFIASISTVLFNANPLLRFDGYYILSDLADIPNLHTRSTRQMRHLVERYLFGYRNSEGVALTRREAVQLVGFGIASGIYRVVVFTTIILFVADQFLLAGLLMAAFCIFAWGVVPIGRLVHYLASSPRLERTRPRASGVVAGAVAILLVFLQFVPFPNAFTAPGILEAINRADVANGSAGFLAEVVAPSGTAVRAGDPLLRLANPALAHQLRQARAQYEEATVRKRQATKEASADIAPLTAYLHSVEMTVERLAAEEKELTVRSRMDGTWVAPVLEDRVGMWLPRGTPVGKIVDERSFEFTAVVSQQEVSRLMEKRAGAMEVRLRGQASRALPVSDYSMVEAEQQILPSAALGWFAGGEVAVVATDRTGLLSAEPFFRLEAAIDSPEGARLLHGRSGRIRVRLAPQPLIEQWSRKIRQMLQKRYQF